MIKHIFAALALCFETSNAGAQSSTAPSRILGPDEILLQVSATGEDRRAADDVTVVVNVSANGATSAEARAANLAKIDRLTNSMVAAGMDRSAISLVPPGGMMGFISNMVDQDEMPPALKGLKMQPPQRTANAAVKIKMSSYGQMARLQTAFDAENVAVFGTPDLRLRDANAAQMAATQIAITTAKKDAQAQATALGMHIVRILRVSNYSGMDFPDYAAPFAQMLELQRGSTGGDVVTHARVYLDFVIAPGAK